MQTVLWVLRIVPALILLQTLFFKFTAAPEAVALFTTLTEGVFGSAALEAPVRTGVGALELITAILLLVPRTTAWGALLAAGSMAGAILSHFTVFGISVGGDGGALFAMAIIVFVASLTLLWLLRKNRPLPAKLRLQASPA